jgi:hypothetical protein
VTLLSQTPKQLGWESCAATPSSYVKCIYQFPYLRKENTPVFFFFFKCLPHQCYTQTLLALPFPAKVLLSFHVLLGQQQEPFQQLSYLSSGKLLKFRSHRPLFPTLTLQINLNILLKTPTPRIAGSIGRLKDNLQGCCQSGWRTMNPPHPKPNWCAPSLQPAWVGQIKTGRPTI